LFFSTTSCPENVVVVAVAAVVVPLEGERL
jgi:hypothetical protein